MTESCLGCGEPLPQRRPLKQFCKYACRGRYRIAEATNHCTGLIGSKNNKQRKALQAEKRASVAAYAFAKVNSCTIRLDRPNKRGAGWLMEVAWPGDVRRRWVARGGNRPSEPLPLEEAKRAAVAMLGERSKGEPCNFIAELNQIAANEVECEVAAQERKQWPVNIMGGRKMQHRSAINSDLREAILSAEVFKNGVLDPAPLRDDEAQLEYHGDGYPVLPACLLRGQRDE